MVAKLAQIKPEFVLIISKGSVSLRKVRADLVALIELKWLAQKCSYYVKIHDICQQYSTIFLEKDNLTSKLFFVLNNISRNLSQIIF